MQFLSSQLKIVVGLFRTSNTFHFFQAGNFNWESITNITIFEMQNLTKLDFAVDRIIHSVSIILNQAIL